MSDTEWIKLGSLIDNARELYGVGSYEKAIKLYLRILQSDILKYENRATIMAELGYCYHDKGDYEIAIKKLKLAKELNEHIVNISGFCRGLGSCFFQIGSYKEAIIYQKKALDMTKSSEEKNELLYQLGRSYLFAGDGKIALKFLEKYLNAIPKEDIENRMDAMYNIGFANIQNSELKNAKESFFFLIKNSRNVDDLARGYYGLTELYYHNQIYRDTLKYGQKVLSIKPQFSERERVLYYLIVSFASEGYTSEALEQAKKFIDEYPNSNYADEVKMIL